MELPLKVGEALLGASIEVPTPDGRVMLKIPPGTSSGAKLRLRGRGVKPPSGERGDLFAEISLKVPGPPADHDAIEEAARKVDALYREDVRAHFKDAAGTGAGGRQ
jgi:DnaJ-class molecular chaperone